MVACVCHFKRQSRRNEIDYRRAECEPGAKAAKLYRFIPFNTHSQIESFHFFSPVVFTIARLFFIANKKLLFLCSPAIILSFCSIASSYYEASATVYVLCSHPCRGNLFPVLLSFHRIVYAHYKVDK